MSTIDIDDSSNNVIKKILVNSIEIHDVADITTAVNRP